MYVFQRDESEDKKVGLESEPVHSLLLRSKHTRIYINLFRWSPYFDISYRLHLTTLVYHVGIIREDSCLFL
jgi:hypothetical protein